MNSLVLCRALQFLALTGGIIGVANGLLYLYDIVEWGIQKNWHFTYFGGWGFRFLAHLNYAALAVILAAPYWLFVRKYAPLGSLANNHYFKLPVLASFLLFALAAMIEYWLEKTLP